VSLLRWSQLDFADHISWRYISYTTWRCDT